MLTRKLAAVVALVMCTLPGACLDLSPLAPQDTSADAGADAPLSDGPVDSACRRCITDDAGSCPTYQQCEQDPQCLVFINCVFDRLCLDLPEWDQRVDCALPCADVAGLPNFNHPAIQMGIQINLCALEGCSHVCAGSEQ